MMWAADLYLVSLLDEYVGSKPFVAEHVRQQLLREEEENRIRQAIENRREGRDVINGPYECWLSYSGVNFTNYSPDLADAVAGGHLLHALFDIALGQTVKIQMLNQYTEVHEVRRSIEAFFIKYSDRMSAEADPDELWWDKAYIPQAISRRWISTALKSNESFLSVLESWVSDSGSLQAWLENLEATTPLVNNPESMDRVLSESAAVGIIKSAKVCHSICMPGVLGD